MIPFTPDDRRAQFAPSQNVGGAVDRDVLDIIGAQPQQTMAAQVDYDVPNIKPVDPDVVDIVNKNQGPLMASLMGASRVNPDQAAEAKRLGSQIGIGQDIALRNMDDVRQRAFMAEVQRRDIARANPVLAGFLSDRTFANEASDDIGVLANIEKAWSYLEELPGEFMAGVRTGQIQVDAGKVGSTALLRGSVTEDEQRQYDAYQKELQKLAGEPGFWREAGTFIGQMERTGEDVVKGAVVGGVAGGGAALVGGQLGPQIFLPEEIVTVPAGVMFGIAAGATSAMFTSSARTMAGLNYMKNLEAGMNPGVSRATALGVGVIGGAFEAYGAKLVAAPFKSVWTRLVSEAASEAVTRPTVGKAVANAGLAYATGVGGEIGTEVAQQVTEIAFDEIAGFASDPEFQSRFATAEGRQGIKDELRDVIVRTALGISVIGGIGPGANLYVDTRRAGKAVKSQQAIQNTVEAINAAKLKQRDPAALEQFGDAALRSTTAFIRGTTMQSLVEASKVSRSELDAIIPGLSGQIQEAVNADNFVSLPLAQFGVRLAGTPLGDAMQPHMTIDPNAMTPTELEAFRANVEQFTELAATEYEAKTEAESAFVQEADQVFSSMRERLVAAGRDPALADIEALMHQAFVVTQAANRGMTPAQFEAESGLREIVGAEMPAAPLEQAARMDADYMAAVESGDMETAQRMVDKAAKAAGYSESGYHGLGEGVLEGQTFDESRKGKRTNAPSARMGFFFASRETAQTYAAQMPVEEELRDISKAARRVAKEFIASIPKKYREQIDLSLLEEQLDRGDRAFMPDDETMPLDIEGPGQFVGLVIDDLYDQFPELIEDVLGVWPGESKAKAQWAKDARKKYLGEMDPDLERFLRESRGQAPALINARLRMQNPLIVDFEGKEDRPESYANVIARAKKTGHDSVIIRNTYDTMRGEPVLDDIKVVFSPKQIKSADPVTRDEAGNVVPLSRRFNLASPRIFEQAAVPASLDAVANVESAFAFAGTKAFKTNREFKQELQDRVVAAAKDARIDLSQFTPEVEQYLVRVAVADAITALRTNPNAVGWYNEKVTKALRLVSLVHPEIANDPRAKFAFTWALAVTSNGLEVNKNFQLAERVYREYKQTGQMPTNVQAGQAQIAINASLGLFNELVAKYGIDAVEKFMTTKTTVKDVMAYTNKNVSGENLTTEVYGAAALGPKIGNGFFANLYGHFEQLTMDRWLMRTWGRWTGTLLDDNKANIATKRKQLTAMIRSLSADDKKAFETILGSKLAVGKPDDVAVAIQKASIKPANRIAMAKIGTADASARSVFSSILGEPSRGIQRVSYGDEMRKLGNALAKYLDGQKEAPSGPPERARIRGVMSRVLAELQTQFPSLTMSDLQALLWYPEKRLYDAAKTADEGKTGYDDNEAPDYANAAANLARTHGITDETIASTIRQVDDELATISIERAAGAERGLGELVLRQAAGVAGGRFEQAARGPARGGYDPSRLKILFGKGADFTTGAHELTHYYVDYYTKQAMAGTAAPQMLADLDAMFKFMGVAGDTPEARLAAFNAMPFETARPLIEAITYNAEVYLFEGKAPSLELAGVFDRMLAFFRRAYKSLADFVTQQQEIYRREFGRELPALNDDLRAVFDRMLADERQIKQAQAVAQMRGQFTVKPEGMDDAEWAAYQEMAGEATNAAIADMTKASLRQMEWLSRARNRIVKELQARHTAQRKEVRERVQKEVQQEPLYRAMAFLRRGQVVAPDGTVTEADGVYKIDRVLAAEFAPTVDLAALGGRYGVLQDDGLHPDIVAEMFGYPTGGTLLEALAAAKPMREAVEDRTDAEMLRLYGEMNTPEAREQEIQKALHNEARARLVGVELRFMGKIQQPVRVLMEAARQAAQQVIDRKRVGELRPSEFVAAEAKAAREALTGGELSDPSTVAQTASTRAYNKAIKDGLTEEEAADIAMQSGLNAAENQRAKIADFESRYAGLNREQIIFRAKRAQLLNNQLAKAALEVKDEIDTDIRYLRRVLRDSNRQRMGADVADQIAKLLSRVNIAPMTLAESRRIGTLAKFLALLEARGIVPDIAEAIGMTDDSIPYKNMTIGEFRDLVDAVKQLEYVGKNERKILIAKEKAEFETVRDEIVKSVVENAGDRKDNARTATTNIGRAVTAMKGFAAAHLKAASIVRILDGGKDGGPLWNYLIRSANEAGDSETSMRAEATADLTKILEPVFRAGKLGGKGVFYPSINRSLNREARLVVALNMGNAGNIQRQLDGEGWSMEAVMPVLQSLTEDELNTVQQIWDYFEKYRPMIGQKERRLYGKEPSWVEPQPLVVRSADGKTVTLRGGYYPIKYDPRASRRAETMSLADEAKRDLAGAYTTATTRRSFVKARASEGNIGPLLYTLAGMYGGINDVIHDLTWHEWLIQANRLMRSNSFDDAVRNRYGPEYVAQLKNWIKDVAAGERGVQNEAEMALNFLRQGISSAGLGFNIVSAAMQITGFNQSIVRVGARWIGRGIAYVAQNPMVAMREVNEKSEFMRNRSRTQFRELNEIRNMVQGQSVAMRRVQMGTYFLMMRMQRMVDVPTWHGAYEKAMYEGRDEETAIALADQAVIDSQGGGMVKDLARVERGGPAVKLFTVFYGYMNTVYNMAAVQTMTNKNKGKLAADYAMLFVVPVVLSYMLKQALIPRKGDEEEEWDMGKIGRELAAEQLSYLMGTMVIAREFGEVGKIIFGVEGPRMGYGGPAGLRAIGETYQFATQASQGEFDTAFRKSAVNMIGAFTGLPSAQVNRTLDGLEALYEGETKNVLAPLTGAKKR